MREKKPSKIYGTLRAFVFLFGLWSVFYGILYWLFGSKIWKWFVLLFVTSMVFYPLSYEIANQCSIAPLSDFNIWADLFTSFCKQGSFVSLVLFVLIHLAIGPFAFVIHSFALIRIYRVIMAMYA